MTKTAATQVLVMYSSCVNFAAFCVPQAMRELAWRKGLAGESLDKDDLEANVWRKGYLFFCLAPEMSCV